MSTRKMWQCTHCSLLNFVYSPNCRACFHKQQEMNNNNKNQELHLFLEGYLREIKQLLFSTIPHEVKEVIMNYYKTYIIFGIGANGYYEFGLDHNEEITKWRRLKEFEALIKNDKNIFRNGSSLIIKSSNNEMYVVGRNGFGRLGIDSDNKPIQILSSNNLNKSIESKDINMICHGILNQTHTFLQSVDHKLYASGNNNTGCFGNGQKNQRTKGVFVEINNINNWLNVDEYIEEIQCCDYITILLTSKKNVFMCGENRNNEFNIDIDDIDTNRHIIIPTLIATNISIISVGGTLVILISDKGILKTFYIKVMNTYFYDNHIKIVDIKSGLDHVVCLSDDGKAYSFGETFCGQCGNGKCGDDAEDIIEPYCINVDVNINNIECGSCHTMLLSKCNALLMFGSNTYKQCSSLLEHDEIAEPHLFNKMDELGNNYYIERVIGMDEETILIINPYKY